MTETYNPLYCYTAEEVGTLMHASTELVRSWATTGLLRGIKTGKGTVYPAAELERFQADLLGADVSNLKKAVDTAGRKNK